jgi:hypothetical protein
MTGPAFQSSTSEQLRDDIDSGRTGDKAPGFDPAAAPMNADAEAGGAAPTAAEIAQARLAERRPGPKRPNAAEPALTPDGSLGHRHVWLGALAGVAAAALLGLVLYVLT